jgi:hemolysin activation/secretion protein
MPHAALYERCRSSLKWLAFIFGSVFDFGSCDERVVSSILRIDRLGINRGPLEEVDVGSFEATKKGVHISARDLGWHAIRHHFKLALKVGLPILLCVSADGFYSQLSAQMVAPSQVTPPTLRPAPTPSGGVTIPTAPGLQTPSGADKFSVTLRQVVIDGAFEALAYANQQLARTVQGRRLTVAQLYLAAQVLEAAYAQAGYILVRVALPPQQLRDGGTLRLIVVDGFIEAIDVKGVPDRVRALVVTKTNGLIGKRRIKLGEIERRLLIAGDAPGLRLRSTLARGQREGGAKLILEGIYRPITVTIGADNQLPTSLGTWSFNASFALNSIFGLGEQLYGSLVAPSDLGQTFDSKAHNRVLGAGAVIPLGVDGWTINPEYTFSRTRPDIFAGITDSIGWYERWAVRTSYPFVRERVHTFVLQGSFEAIKQYNELPAFATDLNRDQYTVLRGGVDIAFPLLWDGASLRSKVLYSRGLGGRELADVAATGIPLTRVGAGPVFSKVAGEFYIFQALPEAFQLALIGRGQSTFDNPVFLSEQFALDAIDGVSSFPAGTFMVDEGVSGRAELIRPFERRTEDFDTTLAPYMFGATGKGYLRMPTAVEPSSTRASSIGFGVRAGLVQMANLSGLTGALEFGKQYSDFRGLSVGYRVSAIISLRH